MDKKFMPKYREDIDGLRAVAILLVVGFHAIGFGGGFVGVDIFFVISGFLISTIILKNLESDSFRFLDFYSRRVRRIFPALLLVLISCFAFGWFALFPDEFKQLNKHISRSSYFVSNFNLLRESNDYFNGASEDKPLLHLWSLAIEEQFYIIWPLLLWCAWKRKLSILRITSFILVASFFFGLLKVYENKSVAFYLPQSRFWELLIGSLLAQLKNQKSDFLNLLKLHFIKKIGHANLLNTISFVGFLLIFIAVLLVSRDENFPGAWALLPTIGAALIILAGSDAWLNRKFLQNPLLMWFGLISYPLYLWHWPLLSFSRIIEGEAPSLLIRLLAVLVSIFLAWLTYEFVEKPIRFGKKQIGKTVALFAAMIFLGVVTHHFYKKQSLRIYQKNAQDLNRPDKAIKSDGSCDALGLNLSKISCLTNSAQPEILIVGDSHAVSLNSAAYLGEVKLKTLLIAANSCLPFDAYSNSKKFTTDDCRNLAMQIKNAVKDFKKIKTVVINIYSPEQKDFARYEFANDGKSSSEEIFLTGLSLFISELISAGKDVVFVISAPKLPYDPKACVARLFHKEPSSKCKIDRATVLEREHAYRKIMLEIKKRNPRLKVFDSAQVFCDEDCCYGKDAKNILYWDTHHLNIPGSAKLLNALIKSGFLHIQN